MIRYRMPESDLGGFTLLELLISLTIIALILVLIVGSLRVSLNIWEKGEDNIESKQRIRVISTLLKQQLRSVCFKRIDQRVQDFWTFRGTDTYVQFISGLTLNPNRSSGLSFVTYQIQKNEKNDSGFKLLVHESEFTRFYPELFELPSFENSGEQLLTSVYDMHFEYLIKNEKSADWSILYDPYTEPFPPQALRIHIIDKPGAAPVLIIVRMDEVDV